MAAARHCYAPLDAEPLLLNGSEPASPLLTGVSAASAEWPTRPPLQACLRQRASLLVGLLVFQSCSSFILSSFAELLQRHTVVVFFLTMLVRAIHPALPASPPAHRTGTRAPPRSRQRRFLGCAGGRRRERGEPGGRARHPRPRHRRDLLARAVRVHHARGSDGLRRVAHHGLRRLRASRRLRLLGAGCCGDQCVALRDRLHLNRRRRDAAARCRVDPAHAGATIQAPAPIR